MIHPTSRRWWTVADAARVLRVHTDTLYDACRVGDFPHQRWDGQIRIPCEALLMTYVPDAATLHLARKLEKHAESVPDFDQLELPLYPPPVPGNMYRNGERKRPHDYENRLWGHNKAV